MEKPHLLDSDNAIAIANETEALHRHWQRVSRRRGIVRWTLLLPTALFTVFAWMRAGMDYTALPSSRNMVYAMRLAETILAVGLGLAAFILFLMSLQFFKSNKEAAFLRQEAGLETMLPEQIAFWRWFALGTLSSAIVLIAASGTSIYIKTYWYKGILPEAEWERDEERMQQLDAPMQLPSLVEEDSTQ